MVSFSLPPKFNVTWCTTLLLVPCISSYFITRQLPDSDRSPTDTPLATSNPGPAPCSSAASSTEDTSQHLNGGAAQFEKHHQTSSHPDRDPTPADTGKCLTAQLPQLGDTAMGEDGGAVCTLEDVTFGWEVVQEEGGKKGRSTQWANKRRLWARSLRSGENKERKHIVSPPPATSEPPQAAEAAASLVSAAALAGAASAAAVVPEDRQPAAPSARAASGSGVHLEEFVSGVSFSLGPTELLAVAGPVSSSPLSIS